MSQLLIINSIKHLNKIFQIELHIITSRHRLYDNFLHLIHTTLFALSLRHNTIPTILILPQQLFLLRTANLTHLYLKLKPIFLKNFPILFYNSHLMLRKLKTQRLHQILRLKLIRKHKFLIISLLIRSMLVNNIQLLKLFQYCNNEPQIKLPQNLQFIKILLLKRLA